MPTFHPLDQLSPVESALCASTVRTYILNNFEGTRQSIKFTYVTLIEPPKAEMIAYLGIATSPTDLNPKSNGILPARRAEVAVIDKLSGFIYVFDLTLNGTKSASVDSFVKLADGEHVGITMEELDEAEQVVRADPEVIRLCAEVGITADQIVCDGWSIGYDERFSTVTRLQQAFIFARLGVDENAYAHPLDFSCVIDSNALKVLHIDFASHRSSATDPFKLTGVPTPHDLTKESLAESGRARIAPPMTRYDYYPDLLAGTKLPNGEPFTLRGDIKPIHVVQPEGVSFKVDGNYVTWQNWSLHIGFNYREGIVLNTVQYFDKNEGRNRPIIYRASIAEMVVPYAAPESPWPRKFALDVGEYGLGMMANELTLGCDCAGEIAYLDTSYISHAGTPIELKNVVCIHEEDAGILWKHSDFRSGNKPHTVRGRKLIIQTVVTVANYEYIFAWQLHQDGTIELETKLTGVLNLYLADHDETDTANSISFGTMVAPRISAPHHQHIFCLRLDPMIDGVNNSVVETDILPLTDFPNRRGDLDWAGNGFVSKKHIISNTSEGARDIDYEKGRMWSFINEDKLHYSSKQPIGYKVMCRDMPPLLARPDSFVGRRTPFATHSFWTTPYVEGQIWPAGKYATQSLKAPEDSLVGWMKGEKNLAKTDIVSYISFGVTHLARPEDFPVMPAEHVSLLLKPVGFFHQSPALDIPPTDDKKSVLVNGAAATNGHANGHANGNGACCQ